MGAHNFETFVPDADLVQNAQQAFDTAFADARREYGNNGYTGTIAEKPGFTMLPHAPMTVDNAVKLMNHMLEKGDKRLDKTCPACCIRIHDEKKKGWLFFGIARS